MIIGENMKSTDKIIEKKVFICPKTGESFDTKAAAARSMKNAINLETREKALAEEKEKREEQKNWIRLNLQNIYDLPSLMEEKAKEFYGLDLKMEFVNPKIRFKTIPDGCRRPIWSEESPPKLSGFATSRLGWCGGVKISICGYKRIYKVRSLYTIRETVNILFAGFNFDSGTSGNIITNTPLEMDCVFYLESFPQLQEQYNSYLINKEESYKYIRSAAEYNKSATDFARNRHEYRGLAKKIEQLKEESEAVLNKWIEAYKSSNSEPEKPVYHGDFGKQIQQFEI